jgi:hypothetical protein
MPPEIDIHAYACGRDVDVLVRPGTRVELSDRANSDHVKSEVAEVALTEGDHLVRITRHTFLGDVTVRTIDAKS